jgi:hypothetical protein
VKRLYFEVGFTQYIFPVVSRADPTYFRDTARGGVNAGMSSPNWVGLYPRFPGQWINVSKIIYKQSIPVKHNIVYISNTVVVTVDLAPVVVGFSAECSFEIVDVIDEKHGVDERDTLARPSGSSF